jgi:hypothetical protein
VVVIESNPLAWEAGSPTQARPVHGPARATGFHFWLSRFPGSILDKTAGCQPAGLVPHDPLRYEPGEAVCWWLGLKSPTFHAAASGAHTASEFVDEMNAAPQQRILQFLPVLADLFGGQVGQRRAAQAQLGQLR